MRLDGASRNIAVDLDSDLRMDPTALERSACQPSQLSEMGILGMMQEQCRSRMLPCWLSCAGQRCHFAHALLSLLRYLTGACTLLSIPGTNQTVLALFMSITQDYRRAGLACKVVSSHSSDEIHARYLSTNSRGNVAQKKDNQ